MVRTTFCVDFLFFFSDILSVDSHLLPRKMSWSHTAAGPGGSRAAIDAQGIVCANWHRSTQWGIALWPSRHREDHVGQSGGEHDDSHLHSYLGSSEDDVDFLADFLGETQEAVRWSTFCRSINIWICASNHKNQWSRTLHGLRQKADPKT